MPLAAISDFLTAMPEKRLPIIHMTALGMPDGASFLLPFYMGTYYGFIVEK